MTCPHVGCAGFAPRCLPRSPLCPWLVLHGRCTPAAPVIVCGLNAYKAADGSCACNPNNVPVGDGINCCRPNAVVTNGACACKAGYTWVDPACGAWLRCRPYLHEGGASISTRTTQLHAPPPFFALHSAGVHGCKLRHLCSWLRHHVRHVQGRLRPGQRPVLPE